MPKSIQGVTFDQLMREFHWCEMIKTEHAPILQRVAYSEKDNYLVIRMLCQFLCLLLEDEAKSHKLDTTNL